MKSRDREGPVEIALVGDLTEHEADLCERLLDVEPGAECVLYFDSPGGSPYCAMALTSLIVLRGLRAVGVVTGECSSSALWPFAACRRRLVTRHSVLLFHSMKWQSEEHVGLSEAAEWARHFGQLESDMDRLLADLFGAPVEQIRQWSTAGRYVAGPELVEAGLAELAELKPLDFLGLKRKR
jgi:ATP-dependent protease ClpP protease subunit